MANNTIAAGGKGTVKMPSGECKGLRNKRRLKSPKAIIAKELKRKMRAEIRRKSYE